MDVMSVALVLGVILALGGTICLFVLVLPEKARPGLQPFLKYVHDFFNFKVLWLEKIMKFCYAFLTLLSIAVGLILFITGPFVETEMMSLGLVLMLLVPILIRILYESTMMFIILVRNSNQINRKLGDEKPEEKLDYSAPVRPEPVYSAPVYAAPSNPGMGYNPPAPPAMAYCPFCGRQQSAENNNCIYCGERIRGI